MRKEPDTSEMYRALYVMSLISPNQNLTVCTREVLIWVENQADFADLTCARSTAL